MNKELPILNKSLVSRVLHSLLERLIREKSPFKSTANIDVFCELEVRDKDGRLLSHKKFKSKSFTSFFLSYIKNALIWQVSGTVLQYRTVSGVFGDGFVDAGTNAILQMLIIDAFDVGAGVATAYITRFDNKTNVVYAPVDGFIPPLAIGALQGDDSYGIQIGTGTTTPTNTDTRLNNKLPNASMNYGGTTFDSTITLQSSTVAIYKIARSFTNATASAITVSEAGIVAKIACRDTTNNNNVFGAVLIIRDTFAGQTVPSGAVLTVRYTIQITT